MSREFDDILNECLERIAEGEDARACAARYPEHEQELLPLLGIASATMRVASTPATAERARERGRARLSEALARGGVPRRPRVIWPWRPVAKPLVIGFVAVLLTAVAAGGTTVASSNSVPGDPLYWVKTTKESISLRLPRSDISNANVHAGLASERGEEMRRLIQRGKIVEAEQVAERMRRHLGKSATYAGVTVPANPIEMPPRLTRRAITLKALELRASLERDGTRLRTTMSRLLQSLPPEHRERVRNMLRRSELRYHVVIEALHAGESPDRLPFWRIEPSRSGPNDRR